MPENIGTADRAVRFVAGLALVMMALGLHDAGNPDARVAWGWIGLVPLATALAGNCPVYALLGIDTRRR